MSETGLLLDELAQRIGYVAFGPGTEDGSSTHQTQVESAVRAVMVGYPIVPCGDESIVLAVDEGELTEAVRRVPVGTNIMSEAILMPVEKAEEIAAAIIAHLRFREESSEVDVREAVARAWAGRGWDTEANLLRSGLIPNKHSLEGEALRAVFAILKPESAQTSGEGE